ncbi:MAG: hypothetical protein L0K89_03690, partial [Bifidobacterium crudilactis]|nr:hypothetical protein [Bifidobacterium crudilactis]
MFDNASASMSLLLVVLAVLLAALAGFAFGRYSSLGARSGADGGQGGEDAQTLLRRCETLTENLQSANARVVESSTRA